MGDARELTEYLFKKQIQFNEKKETDDSMNLTEDREARKKKVMSTPTSLTTTTTTTTTTTSATTTTIKEATDVVAFDNKDTTPISIVSNYKQSKAKEKGGEENPTELDEG